MLFLQAAIAFASCEQPDHRTGVVPMHEMADCDMPLDSATLCLAKTHNEDQALGKTQAGVPDLAAPAAAVRNWQPTVRPLARVERIVPTASSPPPRILFQSFLL